MLGFHPFCIMKQNKLPSGFHFALVAQNGSERNGEVSLASCGKVSWKTLVFCTSSNYTTKIPVQRILFTFVKAYCPCPDICSYFICSCAGKTYTVNSRSLIYLFWRRGMAFIAQTKYACYVQEMPLVLNFMSSSLQRFPLIRLLALRLKSSVFLYIFSSAEVHKLSYKYFEDTEALIKESLKSHSCLLQL